MNKPFRPPFKRPAANTVDASEDRNYAIKRQRVGEISDEKSKDQEAKQNDNVSRPAISIRRPLDKLMNGVMPTRQAAPAVDVSQEAYYLVLWRKKTTKKNKTWDGDGILSVTKGYANLQDVSGRNLGRTQWQTALLPGSELSISGKDVEVDSLISKADYQSGKCFINGVKPTQATVHPQAKRPGITSLHKSDAVPTGISKSHPVPTVIRSKHSIQGFKNPMTKDSKSEQSAVAPKLPVPRHNPGAEGAIVLPRPNSVPNGKQIVDVVVDPILSRHLRDHQRDGLVFLYECVMGMRLASSRGAILADEMGLGKTLQTIAFIWTLLKQNPVHQSTPVVSKVLIVCPAGLTKNWRKEFRKWLGDERCAVFLEEKHNRLTDFTKGRQYPVMIVGYEKLRTIQDQLREGDPIDLIIMDEGHRLKTKQNKASEAINNFETDRRILLTGTPMQNDLSEFYHMVNLVNPGALGKYSAFKREFETPIVQGRQPNAPAKHVEKGQERSEELACVTNQFILRRTADVLSKYLPPKTETVLFCRPTDKQAQLYKFVLDSPLYGSILNSSDSSLQLINILKKLCNSPSLWLKKIKDGKAASESIEALMSSIPPDLVKTGPSASAKIQVLDTLLHELRLQNEEKIVIVSNYTSTLDVIQKLLVALDYPYLRLDGQIAASKRQDLVDKFNKSPPAKCFAFLLSAKAGGTGLNLIGASRLVLFDIDWNPATDLQAMARIHRDGQRRPCFIYRFVVQGALEEKIYQRQIAKIGLSDVIVDAKQSVSTFSAEELRNLFQLDEGVECPTHNLLACECAGSGNAHSLPERDFVDDGVVAARGPWRSTMADCASSDDDDDMSDADGGATGVGVWTSAAALDVAAQERKVQKMLRRKQTDNKMLALMQYLHIDAERIRAGEDAVESLVEDSVLLNVVKEEGSKVSFIFAKTTS